MNIRGGMVKPPVKTPIHQKTIVFFSGERIRLSTWITFDNYFHPSPAGNSYLCHPFDDVENVKILIIRCIVFNETMN
jgi:hypothetical protein